jgi:hypothetical protein
MKLRELLKMAEEDPNMLDYTLCMSTYFVVPPDDEDPEEFKVVVDNPIRGVASNDESKEIRFILNASDISACEKSTDNIKKLWADPGEEDQQ